MEFSDGDRGPAGGLQVLEPAKAHLVIQDYAAIEEFKVRLTKPRLRVSKGLGAGWRTQSSVSAAPLLQTPRGRSPRSTRTPMKKRARPMICFFTAYCLQVQSHRYMKMRPGRV